MKKAIIPISIITTLVLGTIIFLLLFMTTRLNNNKKIINSYDYIVVGDNCSCKSFGRCKYIYGLNGDEITTINKLRYTSNKESFYRIIKGKNEILYLDYKTWHKMYEELNYMECYGCDEQEEAIIKYQKNYRYKDKELETFKTILTLKDYTFNRYIRYYIVSGNEYYIFNSNEGKLYKYNSENESLDEFLDLKTCDIDYFHKGK